LLPSPAAAAAARPAPRPPGAAAPPPPAAAIQHATAPSSLRPGSVNRTSMDLRAEYTVGVHLSFGKRTFNVDEVVVATNTSGVAIDRLELNTAVARLGGLRITAASVAGGGVPAPTSHQTVPLP